MPVLISGPGVIKLHCVGTHIELSNDRIIRQFAQTINNKLKLFMLLDESVHRAGAPVTRRREGPSLSEWLEHHLTPAAAYVDSDDSNSVGGKITVWVGCYLVNKDIDFVVFQFDNEEGTKVSDVMIKMHNMVDVVPMGNMHFYWKKDDVLERGGLDSDSVLDHFADNGIVRLWMFAPNTPFSEPMCESPDHIYVILHKTSTPNNLIRWRNVSRNFTFESLQVWTETAFDLQQQRLGYYIAERSEWMTEGSILDYITPEMVALQIQVTQNFPGTIAQDRVIFPSALAQNRIE